MKKSICKICLLPLLMFSACSQRNVDSQMTFADCAFFRWEYCWSEDYYHLDRITIILNHEASMSDKEYTIDDFPGANLLSVEIDENNTRACGGYRKALLAMINVPECGYYLPNTPETTKKALRQNPLIYSIKACPIETTYFEFNKAELEPSFVDVAYADAMIEYTQSQHFTDPQTGLPPYYYFSKNELILILKNGCQDKEYSISDFPELSITEISDNFYTWPRLESLAGGRKMLKVTIDCESHLNLCKNIRKIANNPYVLYANLC